MATKKHTLKTAVKKPTHAELDAIMLAYERYRDLALADAEDGKFDHDSDAQAAVAFSMGQLSPLQALCKLRKRPVSFLEAPKALAPRVKRMPKLKSSDGKLIPRTVEMLSTAERADMLVKIPGTRAHARAILEANAPHPFD